MDDYSISWDGIDKLDAALADQQKMTEVKNVVKKHTAQLMQASQRSVPVDSGNLKKSSQIRIEDGGMSGVVSYGNAVVNYAAYVEFGTRFMTARKYLGTPFMSEKMKFIADLERLVK